MNTPIIYIGIMLFSFAANSAVSLSHNKTGQALIIPYYTVANNLNTLVSVNNVQDQAKAIKVNIRDGKKGSAMYSFNLYLDENDMWAFVMVNNGDGVLLFSTDQSCTLNLNSFNPTPPINSEPNSWDWQTGYIEIIEMGNVLTESNDFFGSSPQSENCQQLNDAWYASGPNSLWQAESTAELSPASGGLSADVGVIDVVNGFAFKVPTLSFENFFPANTIYHRAPESTEPNLSSGSHDSLLIHKGEAVQTTWPTGYEAVSALLMKSTLENHFYSNPALGAKTEWVFTFPTWPYHLASEDTQVPFFTNNDGGFKFHDDFNQEYSVTDHTGRLYSLHSCCLDPLPPFPNLFLTSVVNTYTLLPFNDQSETSISGDIRENRLVFHFQSAGLFDYAEGLEFYDGKMIFNIIPNKNSMINDRGLDSNSNELVEYHGLPVFGFSVTSFVNANAQPGLLATYANAKSHTGRRIISIPEP